MNALDEVARATIRLMMKAPFYGHLLSGLAKEVTESVESIGVGVNSQQMYVLKVHPTRWLELYHTEALRVGSLRHQMLHLALKHVTRAPEFAHTAIFWMAADLVVDQYLEPDELPFGPIPDEIFQFFGIQPFQGVDAYYHALLAYFQQQPSGGGLLDEGSSGDGQQTGGGEDQEESEGTSTPADQSGSKPAQGGVPQHAHLDSHEPWQSMAAQPAGARRVLDTFVDEAIARAARRVGPRHWGNLPGRIRISIEELLEREQARIDWRRVMRLFSERSRRTWLKSTVRRPSKRYGTTPGIKVRRKHSVLVAVDTSASIGLEELRLFFSEIHHIWRQGADVEVVGCDVEIHDQYTYRGRLEPLTGGGGGTDFNDPVRLAHDRRPDALIYMTDGYAPRPEAWCSTPILWVICPDGAEPSELDLPGRIIQMTT